MPTLSWTLNAAVQNGPTIAVAQTLAIESYDKTEVTIPPTTATTVNLPGAQMQFLAILADRYGADLTYKVTGGLAASIQLDAPQILVGAGALELLGGVPTALVFTNDLAGAKPVAVQILVGRVQASFCQRWPLSGAAKPSPLRFPKVRALSDREVAILAPISSSM
jgi:hypothetical protein